MAEQPCPAEGPIAFQARDGDPESFRGLRLRQSGEEAQFDNTGNPRLKLLQPLERVAKFQQILFPLPGQSIDVRECKSHSLTSALCRLLISRVIHKNPPELLSGHREKMSAILPRYGLGLSKLQEQFMYERSWLQRMSGALISHVGTSQPSELTVHGIDQPRSSRWIALAPAGQQRCDRFVIPAFPCHQECVTAYQVETSCLPRNHQSRLRA